MDRQIKLLQVSLFFACPTWPSEDGRSDLIAGVYADGGLVCQLCVILHSESMTTFCTLGDCRDTTVLYPSYGIVKCSQLS